MTKAGLLKKMFNFFIGLFCGIFVIVRTHRCIQRYHSRPKASEIKISNGVHELFPEFTICQQINKDNNSTPTFKLNGLENCGLTESDYKYKYKWFGTCENAKSLYENISFEIGEIVKVVTIERRFLKNDIKFPAELQYWNIIDDPR